ncbi:MAG: DUF2283 domain-containing protein [Cyanobacteria bacterium P01_A01_bin.123]
MKLTYFPDTDTLYIDLADRPSMASEVANDKALNCPKPLPLSTIAYRSKTHRIGVRAV